MYTIERSPHDEEHPYTMVATDLIRDETLHPITRWILISLLSNKSGWKINASQFVNLLKKHKIGRNKVYEFFKEAIQAGYLEKVTYLESNLTRTKYYLHERPKLKKSFRHPDSGTPEEEVKKSFRHPGGGDSEDEDYKYNQESSKEDLKEDYAHATKSDLFVFNRVKMEKEEYEELIRDFGKEKIQEMLEKMDEYADVNPKRFKQYANHSSVIRNWMRKEPQYKAKNSQASISILIEKIKKEAPHLIRAKEIEIGPNSIAFIRGMYNNYIPYDDKEFERKLKVELDKIKVRI